jgi:hypothetical protein
MGADKISANDIVVYKKVRGTRGVICPFWVIVLLVETPYFIRKAKINELEQYFEIRHE